MKPALPWFPEAMFATLIALFVYATIRMQRDERSDFDFANFFIKDSNADIAKFGFLMAIVIAAWVMFFLAYNDKMTEGYFGIFIGAFVLGKLGDAAIRKEWKKPPTPEGDKP